MIFAHTAPKEAFAAIARGGAVVFAGGPVSADSALLLNQPLRWAAATAAAGRMRLSARRRRGAAVHDGKVVQLW